jgi:hypothetical protein
MKIKFKKMKYIEWWWWLWMHSYIDDDDDDDDDNCYDDDGKFYNVIYLSFII